MAGEGLVFVGLTAANYLVPSGGQIKLVHSNGMTETPKVFQKIFMISSEGLDLTVGDSKRITVD